MPHRLDRLRYRNTRLSRELTMTQKVWQAPKVETTPVSMEVTMYLPAQA